MKEIIDIQNEQKKLQEEIDKLEREKVKVFEKFKIDGWTIFCYLDRKYATFKAQKTENGKDKRLHLGREFCMKKFQEKIKNNK